MTATLQDYFLPGYIEEALKAAGRFRVDESTLAAGLILHHLRVDRDVLRVIGRVLRARRDELLGNVDLRDVAGLAGRLSALGALVAAVGDAGSALRKDALEILPRISGFSAEMIAILLDSFAALDVEEILGRTGGALPSNRAAVAFVQTGGGYARYYPGALGISFPGLLARSRRHRGQPVSPLPLTGPPGVVSNVAAGNVPGIALMEALLAACVGAASLGKNANAEPYFGPRFLQELATWESQRRCFPLTDLMPLVTFPGTEKALLQELIHQGDHLQATGGLDAKRAIAGTVRRLRHKGLRDLKRRISGHWHKISFDLVGREYLAPPWLDTVAFNVAFDNSMFDTQGCLSAQQVFVEGSEADVLRFAGRFVEEMRAILPRLPKGAEPQARLREMYQWYERRPGYVILTSLSDMLRHPFFVAYDNAGETLAAHNALNRSILVRRVDRLETALPRLLGRGERRDLLQSCGVAVPQARLLGLAEILGRAGVNRIVPAGSIWDLRLGVDSWDGYLPPTDLIAPQLGYWTTISFRDSEPALLRARTRNEALLDGGAANGFPG